MELRWSHMMVYTDVQVPQALQCDSSGESSLAPVRPICGVALVPSLSWRSSKVSLEL